MIHVLTCESEQASATRLRYEDVTTDVKSVEDWENDLVIRWGRSAWSWTTDYRGNEVRAEYNRVINPRRAIYLNCCKAKALQRLQEVVNTPNIWLPGQTVPEGQEAVHRAVHHAGGAGFNVQTGPFVVAPESYATSWIPSRVEYRVWFCGDDTMCGVRRIGSVCPDKYPCRSQWGYDFKQSVPAKLHKDTLLAASTIGLEFGAADIMYLGDKFYFLELNSAPTIDKLVIEEFYKASMKKLIKKKYPDFKQ